MEKSKKKSELIDLIAEKAGVSKKDAATVIEVFTETVVEELKCGRKVQLSGFGTFEVKERKPRTGKDMRTKEPISIPGCNVPKFKPGKQLKEAIK